MVEPELSGRDIGPRVTADEIASMNDDSYMSESDPPGEIPDWISAIAIALATAILLVVFIWIIVRLEPVLSDFVASDTPIATATPSD